MRSRRNNIRLSDFDLYRDLLARECGLSITEEQSFLLSSRLQPVARKWGYFSPSAMGLTLRGMPDAALVRDIVEAMVPHDSAFFRDSVPFERLGDTLLPALMIQGGRKTKRLRLWSAGCAAGQEPYSLAMAVREVDHMLTGWEVEIAASDISGPIIAQAREGLYSPFEVQQGLSARQMVSRFEKQGETWRIGQDIRGMVSFSTLNLLHDMSGLGTFDVIFCRYVLGTMTDRARTDILTRLASRLAPDGLLVLGLDETAGDSPLYRAEGLFPGLYVHAAHAARLRGPHSG